MFFNIYILENSNNIRFLVTAKNKDVLNKAIKKEFFDKEIKILKEVYMAYPDSIHVINLDNLQLTRIHGIGW